MITKINKDYLLEVLRTNRDNNKEVFEEAWHNYKKAVVAELERALEDARSGKRIDPPAPPAELVPDVAADSGGGGSSDWDSTPSDSSTADSGGSSDCGSSSDSGGGGDSSW